MSILITGANGYLGKHLTLCFNRARIDCTGIVRRPDEKKLVCDLSDRNATANLMKHVYPDLIIHCAAFVPQTLSDYSSSELSANNTKMLENIIDCTKCPIIYISSMTVYGDSIAIIRNEKDAGNPQSAYGQSKLDGETILKNSGRNSLAIRIPGLFGGGRNTGLIANVISCLMENKQPELPSKSLIWAAMDVHDAANYIFKLSMSEFFDFNPINVAYEDVYSINNFLKICENIFDKKIDSNITHPEFSFDLSRLKSFGIYPKENLKSVLIKYKKLLHEYV